MKDRCVKSFNRVEANLSGFVSVIADGALPLPTGYPNLIHEPPKFSFVAAHGVEHR